MDDLNFSPCSYSWGAWTDGWSIACDTTSTGASELLLVDHSLSAETVEYYTGCYGPTGQNQQCRDWDGEIETYDVLWCCPYTGTASVQQRRK